MTNGIGKVWKGVEIFNQRNLDSCKFITDSGSEYGLVYNYLFLAVSNANWYHSKWCTTYQDYTLSVSIFLVSGKRDGEVKNRETPPSLHNYFLFSQVGCTAIVFHTGFYSTTRNWRELYKNLTVLSCLDIITRYNLKN